MRRRSLAVLASVPLLFAAACGSGGDAGTASGAASGSPAGGASALKVTGAPNAKPSVAFPAKVVETSSYQVITPGTVGAAAKEGGSVVANFTVFTWDGKENKQTGSTYDEGGPQLITINQEVPEILRKGFTETKGGGRFLSVVAKDSVPAEQQAQVPAGQSQVFVVDVVGVPEGKAAQGTATDPGLKGVKVENPGGDAAPKLTTKTKEKAPKKLVAETVIKGSGPAVKSGQSILVQYAGKIWGSDVEFDSSWSRGGQPIMFQIGTGKVIKGWDEGLVGVPVGSRVLLSIPPDLGYGKQGSGDKIKGTDTLVFLVDVVAAY
ncbi:FKBP-type peptidyl-prolyl cis-trans isomerase [Streptosporangium sp. NBC_01639]|uniref:FKBP-type peptidyl-prolyl cis-trans isomerase n=1 Tax=unclassified Streptosporangium TaxID=2632669 RepID=UPI002DDA9911|nr:FKBP-type peptidyl-prolyl cis-trans isomerase [Streptosporangium sp. NBC_01756]WSC87022.1 FKBP-type peptidyl-prolyl cis-trans isomerase [Streptosporangium sp. NBC_01756]WTD54288.1 FKBP-type peptidyl-prolyl cis-trans isomerase [Streptosporangium sp. NBC_01639]